MKLAAVLDEERCYRAVLSRDRRFDGWFTTAVATTGIYCRPSCPAKSPKRANVRFFASAAAAQGVGYRASYALHHLWASLGPSTQERTP